MDIIFLWKKRNKMAAATLARKEMKALGSSKRESLKRDVLSLTVMPDKKEWIADHELEMLMLDGIWRLRRLVYTREYLYLARPTTNIVLDSIPLHEIDAVFEMNDVTDKSPNVKAQAVKPIVESTVDSRLMDTSTLGASEMPSDDISSLTECRSFLAEASLSNILQIKTSVDGVNSGRTYYFSTRSSENPETRRQMIVAQLFKMSHVARRNAQANSQFEKGQQLVRIIQESMWFQSMVALLIIANFAVNAAEAQVVEQMTDSDGQLTTLGAKLETLDTFFTIIFTVELLINAYSHWFRDFIGDGWNTFDIIVVTLSLVALGPVNMPINVLRSMRAFRVIRLFGRMGSLRDIVAAITSSIIPVMNAFLVMLIVASIYSVLGTTFFGSMYPDHFGRFDRLLATLFCVAGGLLGWMDLLPEEAVASGEPTLSPLFLFVGSFVVIVNWTLLQISVAVLLDSFLTARAQKTQDKEAEQVNALTARNTIRSALDPLLQALSRDYVDYSDLSNRLRKLFDLLDTDDSNGLNSKEFRAGIRKLDFKPPIHLSEEDFAIITNNGDLLDESGQLGFSEFEAVMITQIRLYVQRQLSNTLIAAGSRFEVAQLTTMKSLFHENSKLQEQQERLSESVASMQKDISRAGDGMRNLVAWARTGASPPSPRLHAARPRRRRSGKGSIPEIFQISTASSGGGNGGSGSVVARRVGCAQRRRSVVVRLPPHGHGAGGSSGDSGSGSGSGEVHATDPGSGGASNHGGRAAVKDKSTVAIAEDVNAGRDKRVAVVTSPDAAAQGSATDAATAAEGRLGSAAALQALFAVADAGGRGGGRLALSSGCEPVRVTTRPLSAVSNGADGRDIAGLSAGDRASDGDGPNPSGSRRGTSEARDAPATGVYWNSGALGGAGSAGGLVLVARPRVMRARHSDSALCESVVPSRGAPTRCASGPYILARPPSAAGRSPQFSAAFRRGGRRDASASTAALVVSAGGGRLGSSSYGRGGSVGSGEGGEEKEGGRWWSFSSRAPSPVPRPLCRSDQWPPPLELSAAACI